MTHRACADPQVVFCSMLAVRLRSDLGWSGGYRTVPVCTSLKQG